MSKAPWPDEQVKNLNEFQKLGVMHPFTCPNHSDTKHAHSRGYLIATNSGWLCDSCDYTQDWAHEFMLNFEAKNP